MDAHPGLRSEGGHGYVPWQQLGCRHGGHAQARTGPCSASVEPRLRQREATPGIAMPPDAAP